MSPRALGVGEHHESLETSEVVEQLLALTLEEQVLLRIADQGGEFDLLGDAITLRGRRRPLCGVAARFL